jgi:hypothetical protein
MFVLHDIRSYYEELAFELTRGPFEAWGAERWFYDETEAGKIVLEARHSMKDSGAAHSEWFYLAPATRVTEISGCKRKAGLSTREPAFIFEAQPAMSSELTDNKTISISVL